MAKFRHEDAEFMSDLRAAVARGPRLWTSALLVAIILVLAAAVYWTSQARVPLVTNGQGQVIPSSQVQVVQDLEGGIVEEILVREGDVVSRGQVLLRKNDIQFASKFREDYGRYLSLLAEINRLTAETEGRKPVYDDEIVKNDPKLIERQNALYEARKSELDASISVLTRQAEQRRQEMVELDSRIESLQGSLRLANQEYDILQPLVASGVTSKVELLRLERSINDIKGTLEAARQAIPRARSALSEVNRRIEERKAQAQTESQKDLNEAKVKAAALSESLASMRDRVARTEIRSPVDGTVKKLNINTVGGVIRPGVDLIEIVPLEDSLLIEARVRPADIGFIHPGNKAKVKITAYTYTDYGSLDAEVEDISPDTIVDEKGESFYQIRVRTDRNFLGEPDKPLPIKVGMVAQVDIVTGDRTVLQYILKPILRAREKALREP